MWSTNWRKSWLASKATSTTRGGPLQARLTRTRRPLILRSVQSPTRRIAAAALSLILSFGGLGLCAGQATPEARMACCTDLGTCPMHHGTPDGSTRVVTQADADACCASSDRDESTPSASMVSPVVALALTTSPVPAMVLPQDPLFAAFNAPLRLPGGHVPKHVLLSVFLI